MLELDINLQRNEFELDIATTIGAGVTAIYGPSGSGKTSLLKAIAGLVPAQGQVTFMGTTWLDTAQQTRTYQRPTYQRPIGLLFQDDRLFAHLNVLGNLNFAVKRAPRRKPEGERHPTKPISLEAVVEIFNLAMLLERSVTNLSGGERRRVAMAQTLLTQPQLLLLDEPLSGLDEARKREILPFLYALANEFATPTLYVSHQLEEVSQLCQNMLVIDQGALRFHGTTHAGVNFVEAKLNNLMTTDLSFLTGTVIEKNDTYHLTTLDVAGQKVQIPQSQYRNLQTGDQVTLNIKPSDVALALAQPSGISIRNILQGVVTNIAATERFTDITLTIGDQTLRSRITLAAANELKLVPGMTLYALLKSSGLS